MTYRRLKDLTSFFLVGDIRLPDDNEVLLAGVQAALYHVAIKANALKLYTKSPTASRLRQGPGDYWIRVPNLPTDDSDSLDIDDELGQAVARYLCSFISKDGGLRRLHKAEAIEIIEYYNSKTNSYIDRLEHENKLEHEGTPGYIEEGLY